jgi:hypothetical protein
MIYKLREPAAVMTQASMAIIMPLLVGGIYWNIPLTQTAVTDRLAAISFLVLVQSFMCMDQILLFPKERAVYLRDHATGLHSTSSFFLARTLAEMPFILLFAVISAVISYWMCVTRYGSRDPAAHLPAHHADIAQVWLPARCPQVLSLRRRSGRRHRHRRCIPVLHRRHVGDDGDGQPAGHAGHRHPHAAGWCARPHACLSPSARAHHAFNAGFYRNLADIPLWCRWVSKFSFLGYGVQAVAANEFRGLEFTCTPEEAAAGCIPNGDAFLRRLSMQDIDIGAYIGYILIIGAGSRFFAYLSLRFLFTGQTFRERLAQP